MSTVDIIISNAKDIDGDACKIVKANDFEIASVSDKDTEEEEEEYEYSSDEYEYNDYDDEDDEDEYISDCDSYEYIDEDDDDDDKEDEDVNAMNKDSIASSKSNVANLSTSTPAWIGDPNAPPLYRFIVNRQWDAALPYILSSSKSQLCSAASYTTPDTFETPLHAACLRGAPLSLLNLVLEANTDAAKAQDVKKRLPLHHAARYNSSNVIAALLKYYPQGGRVSKDVNNCSPYDVAVTLKRELGVLELLGEGSRLYNAIYCRRWTEVDRLLQEEMHVGFLEYLDFDDPDDDDTTDDDDISTTSSITTPTTKTTCKTALHYVLSSHVPISIVQRLLQIYPSATEQLDKDGNTPFLILCQNDWQASSSSTQSAPPKSDKQQQNSSKIDNEDSKQEKEDLSLAQLIYQHTSLQSKFQPNNDNITPLYASIQSRIPPCFIQQLLNLSTTQTLQNVPKIGTAQTKTKQWTLLHAAAAYSNNDEMIQMILEYCPEAVEIKDRFGVTFFHYALENTSLSLSTSSSHSGAVGTVASRQNVREEDAAGLATTTREGDDDNDNNGSAENINPMTRRERNRRLLYRLRRHQQQQQAPTDNNNNNNNKEKTGISDTLILTLFNTYPKAASLNHSITNMAPLHLAIESNRNIDIIRTLLNADVTQLSQVDHHNRTPLLLAAEFATDDNNNDAVAKLILEQYPKAVGIKDKEDRTPLFVACQRKYPMVATSVEATTAVTAAAAVVEEGDAGGGQQQQQQQQQGNGGWMSQLPLHSLRLNHGEYGTTDADTMGGNAATTTTNNNATRLNAIASKTDLIQSLLNKRPDLVATPTIHGETPLLYACAKTRDTARYELIMRLLHAYPAAVFVCDGKKRRTPLLMALMNGAELPIILEILLAADEADVSIQGEKVVHKPSSSADLVLLGDDSGQTPLHGTIPSGSEQIILALLNANPNCVKVKSRNGNSPAKLACLNGRSAKLIFELVKADPTQLQERDDLNRPLSYYLWKFVHGAMLRTFTSKIGGAYFRFPPIPSLPDSDGGRSFGSMRDFDLGIEIESDDVEEQNDDDDDDDNHSTRNRRSFKDLNEVRKLMYDISVFLLKEESKERNAVVAAANNDNNVKMDTTTMNQDSDWNMVKTAILSNICPETVIALAVHYHPEQVVSALRSDPSMMHHLFDRKSAGFMGYHDCDYCRVTVVDKTIAFHRRIPHALCDSCCRSKSLDTLQYNKLPPVFNGEISSLLIEVIMTHLPAATSIPDKSRGRLPLNAAIEAGMSWNSIVENIFKSAPEAVGSRDQATHMFPFMLAAVGEHDTSDGEKDGTSSTKKMNSMAEQANPNSCIDASYDIDKSRMTRRQEEHQISRLDKMTMVFELLSQNPTTVISGV